MKNNTQVLNEQKCKQKDETILSLRYNVALEISLLNLLGAEKQY